jgi:predicted TPR repeat methyltransferase
LGLPQSKLQVLDAGCGTGRAARWLRPFAARLVGVDLSEKMIEKARTCGLFDELHVAELGTFLQQNPLRYELIAAVDTVVYFGELRTILATARSAVPSVGWLFFTVEALEIDDLGQGYRLNPSGRYSHTREYVVESLSSTGWDVQSLQTVVLREEAGQPVEGYLLAARACPSQNHPRVISEKAD